MKLSGKKIVWFINIDTVDYLDFSFVSSKENMENLIKNEIDGLIILPQQKNGFLRGACKVLSTEIKKYVEYNHICKEDQKIIWLEDDWKIINNMTHLMNLHNIKPDFKILDHN